MTDPVQVEIDFGPIELDPLTYWRLLTGAPVIGEVIGGPLDGLELEFVEASE